MNYLEYTRLLWDPLGNVAKGINLRKGQGVQEVSNDPNTLTRYISAVLKVPMGEVFDTVGARLKMRDTEAA